MCCAAAAVPPPGGWGRTCAQGLARCAPQTRARDADWPAIGLQIAWAHYARCYGKQLMDYIMGSTGRSFVTGWGVNPPKRPHHRTSSCAYVLEGELCDRVHWEQKNLTFANVLPGGLVAGPDNVLDEWVDDHHNFETSEVANDFNAALVSGARALRRNAPLPRPVS